MKDFANPVVDIESLPNISHSLSKEAMVEVRENGYKFNKFANWKDR